jgi:hypothetical protein
VYAYSVFCPFVPTIPLAMSQLQASWKVQNNDFFFISVSYIAVQHLQWQSNRVEQLFYILGGRELIENPDKPEWLHGLLLDDNISNRLAGNSVQNMRRFK